MGKLLKSIEVINRKLILTDEICLEISKMVTNYCGIQLGLTKKIMIQSRLDRVINRYDFNSYIEYLKVVKNNRQHFLEMIDALTTNKTEFWREKAHYDFIRDEVIKRITSKAANTRKTYFFWSAACSSGEEVYSLAMLLEKIREKYPDFKYKILGTDIDSTMIAAAEEGVYRKDILTKLSPSELAQHFKKGVGSRMGYYRISDELRDHTKFRRLNLLDPQAYLPVVFDFILLRNVLIYFSTEDIQRVYNKLYQHMGKDSFLIVGHSESLNNIRHKLTSISSSIYHRSV